jgi:uncharacterized protein (DUF1330 family)
VRDTQAPLAYVISGVTGFADPLAVRQYAGLAGPAIEQFGGRFVVSNTRPNIVEGASALAHLSIVEFPSMDRARAWYDSPEYADARDLTPLAFEGRLLLFVRGNTAGST